MYDIKKKDFFELIREGPYKGQYLIKIDKENHWGLIVCRKTAEATWSRFKSSGKTFEQFCKEFL